MTSLFKIIFGEYVWGPDKRLIKKKEILLTFVHLIHPSYKSSEQYLQAEQHGHDGAGLLYEHKHTSCSQILFSRCITSKHNFTYTSFELIKLHSWGSQYYIFHGVTVTRENCSKAFELKLQLLLSVWLIISIFNCFHLLIVYNVACLFFFGW